MSVPPPSPLSAPPAPSLFSSTSIPSFFTLKKSQILNSLATSALPSYTDKSPKGSIDADIVDLIDLINSFPGYVTTSSCAGRVAVFVEGRKTLHHALGDSRGADLRSGPGGKGAGNRWLYVSHSPVPSQLKMADNDHAGSGADVDFGVGMMEKQHLFHDLFSLTPQSMSISAYTSSDAVKVEAGTEKKEKVVVEERYPTAPNVRLVKLSFSPLILHILCSSLHTAKPLLAAAINAGFRESGVQSLKALDDEEAGVMVAIRTAGLAFETVVGWVEEKHQEQEGNHEQTQDEVKGRESGQSETYKSCVSEGVLRMFVGVVNDRFGWNEQRRERLRTLLLSIGKERQDKDCEWEDSAARKERKREEGLRRQKEKGQNSTTMQEKESNGHGEEVVGIDTEILEDMDLFQEAT